MYFQTIHNLFVKDPTFKVEGIGQIKYWKDDLFSVDILQKRRLNTFLGKYFHNYRIVGSFGEKIGDYYNNTIKITGPLLLEGTNETIYWPTEDDCMIFYGITSIRDDRFKDRQFIRYLSDDNRLLKNKLGASSYTFGEYFVKGQAIRFFITLKNKINTPMKSI